MIILMRKSFDGQGLRVRDLYRLDNRNFLEMLNRLQSKKGYLVLEQDGISIQGSFESDNGKVDREVGKITKGVNVEKEESSIYLVINEYHRGGHPRPNLVDVLKEYII